ILVGVAVVELDGYHCLCGSGDRRRPAGGQQHSPGSDEGHDYSEDDWRAPRDALYSVHLHGLLLLVQPAICQANASGEEAPRSIAGSSVDQDCTLSWKVAELPLNCAN